MSENVKNFVHDGAFFAAEESGAGFGAKADRALNVESSRETQSAAGMVKCRLNLTGVAADSSLMNDDSQDGGLKLLDVGSGKDGVLSRRDAEQVELRVMSKIEVDAGRTLADTKDTVLRQSFLVAFRLYLAMHSSENADDGSGAIEDGVTFSFGATTLSGAAVKTAAQMSSFHRYLRCRADEVRDAIKFILSRAGKPDAERKFPLACETARLLRVNAANRHMPDFPQYAFVGGDYSSTVTPRVREVIAASKATLLAAQRVPDARIAHRFNHAPKGVDAMANAPDF